MSTPYVIEPKHHDMRVAIVAKAVCSSSIAIREYHRRVRGLAIATSLLAACGEGASLDVDAGIAVAVRLELTGKPVGSVVAYQDGSGAWQHAPEPVDGAYQVEIHSSTYAFAWGCVEPDVSIGTASRYVELAYASIDHDVLTRSLGCSTSGGLPIATETPVVVTTTCEETGMVSTWEPTPGATAYSWRASYTPFVYCATTHTSCPVTWNATFEISSPDWSPRFEQPDLTKLAGWSSVLALPCQPAESVSVIAR